ncbi:hypothetical protein J6524_10200 [Bradyrhizobium sp. WSM 1738]|uniref:hypothetical protein n=1 Tax=Bradyrhizobium hereditatis TaxID=2821405 RepID=UPI001CE28EDA|nr:hypothetical protein [Bradyrhizobium hereditatis]MCA6115264.1 hypothetical protein [Bradyrhizobium hereditatis]
MARYFYWLHSTRARWVIIAIVVLAVLAVAALSRDDYGGVSNETPPGVHIRR